MLKDFDALVLLLADLPNCREIMHAKLPFYLAAGRPIIAIVPEDSICAQIIKKCHAGWVISPSTIVTGLSRAIELLKSTGWSPDNRQIGQYELRRVERLWASALSGSDHFG